MASELEHDTGGRLNQAARIAEILMGLVFVVAGAVKTWDPVLFFWEVVPYTYMLNLGPSLSPIASKAALFLGPVEVALGLALLAHWLPRWVFPVVTGLMVFFTAVVTVGWMRGYDDSCGCFGTLIERGAREAVVEDVVMLGMVVFAWWGTRSLRVHSSGRWFVLGGTVLALVVGGSRFYPDRDRIEDSDLRVGVVLKDLKGPDMDLMVGDYLVVVMSPNCPHCQRATLKLNAYANKKWAPRIVGLTRYAQDSKAMKGFQAQLKPRFPIATVSGKDFMRLAWGHGYPRFAYLQNGVVQQVWEYNQFPQRDEILAWGKEGRGGDWKGQEVDTQKR